VRKVRKWRQWAQSALLRSLAGKGFGRESALGSGEILYDKSHLKCFYIGGRKNPGNSGDYTSITLIRVDREIRNLFFSLR
jgi:hypothetical protein